MGAYWKLVTPQLSAGPLGGAKRSFLEIVLEETMKINIDNLNESELIELNNRIIQRLRILSKMRSHKEMMKFNVGDRVTFQPEGHPAVIGMLIRFNSKTVTVITDEGEHWNVMPRFLHKNLTPENMQKDNSNIIRMK